MPVRDSGEVAVEHQLLPPQAHALLILDQSNKFPALHQIPTSTCIYADIYIYSTGYKHRHIPRNSCNSFLGISDLVPQRQRIAGLSSKTRKMESGGFLFDPSLCSGSMLFLGSGDNTPLPGARSAVSMGESSKRRPFVSLSEELYDEYYDEQMPEKKRRLTIEQVHLLEKSFEEENKLEPERKIQLAKKLGLQPRQVAVWFQNRRARWKTKQLERDYDLLKSSYDSLLLNYDSLAKENEQLKSQLVALTEKLQAREVTGGAPTEAQKLEAAFRLGSTKVGDRLSSGSGGSSVVDEDRLQLLDSGDSYFEYPGCMSPFDGIRLEDDRTEDGHSYLPCDVFAAAAAAAASEHGEEEEPMCWWVWS